MRQFEIAPGGCTPKHTHAHEHEVFVLEGTGVVLLGDQEHPLRAGTAVFVPPGRYAPVPQHWDGLAEVLVPYSPIRFVECRACVPAACGCE